MDKDPGDSFLFGSSFGDSRHTELMTQLMHRNGAEEKKDHKRNPAGRPVIFMKLTPKQTFEQGGNAFDGVPVRLTYVSEVSAGKTSIHLVNRQVYLQAQKHDGIAKGQDLIKGVKITRVSWHDDVTAYVELTRIIVKNRWFGRSTEKRVVYAIVTQANDF